MQFTLQVEKHNEVCYATDFNVSYAKKTTYTAMSLPISSLYCIHCKLTLFLTRISNTQLPLLYKHFLTKIQKESN